MSNKSMFRKFMPGNEKKEKPATPRTKELINQEYTQLAQSLGDLFVKQESIKRQLDNTLRRVDQLGFELNERSKLDDEEAEKNNKEIRDTKQADAGIPNGETAAN